METGCTFLRLPVWKFCLSSVTQLKSVNRLLLASLYCCAAFSVPACFPCVDLLRYTGWIFIWPHIYAPHLVYTVFGPIYLVFKECSSLSVIFGGELSEFVVRGRTTLALCFAGIFLYCYAGSALGNVGHKGLSVLAFFNTSHLTASSWWPVMWRVDEKFCKKRSSKI